MFNETNYLNDLGDACDQYLSQIYAAADKYGIDRGVALAQIRQESGCKPTVCSSAGACGIAQFIPSTWAQYGTGSRTDVGASLDAWGKYMRDLLNRYSGDYSLALAAYNAGPRRVDQYGGVPPPSFAKGQTYNYVQAIMRFFTGSSGGDGPGATDGDGSPPPPETITSPVDLFSGLPPGALAVGGIILAYYLFFR